MYTFRKTMPWHLVSIPCQKKSSLIQSLSVEIMLFLEIDWSCKCFMSCSIVTQRRQFQWLLHQQGPYLRFLLLIGGENDRFKQITANSNHGSFQINTLWKKGKVHFSCVTIYRVNYKHNYPNCITWPLIFWKMYATYMVI